MPYTHEQIQAAARRQQTVAAERGESVMGEDGARVMSVDAVLFHNGVQVGKEMGFDNIWKENPEWVADQARRHPEIAVKVRSGKIRVGPAVVDGMVVAGGRLTRFGRTTFRKVYGTNGTQATYGGKTGAEWRRWWAVVCQAARELWAGFREWWTA